MNNKELKETLISAEDYRSYKLSNYTFDMFVTDSVYNARDYMFSSLESLRVFIDEKQSIYLISKMYEATHTAMIELSNVAYKETSLDDFDNKKICLLYIPHTEEYFDEEYDAINDDYDTCYTYDDFVIYTRYIDFKNFKLYNILGEPLSIRKLSKLEEKYVDEDSLNYDSRGWIIPNGEIISTKNRPHFDNKHDIEEQDKDIKYNFGYERYIGLPKERPTQKQLDTLLKLLDLFFVNKEDVGIRNTDIEICYDMNEKGDFKTINISPEEYISDDVIKLIKRLYTSLQEKIVKKGNKWQVQSEKGRNMGTYNTKKEAEKRLQQVHYFKHMNESDEPDTFTLPKELTDKFINNYKETYKTLELKKLPIDKLVTDNNLLNDDDLESYHKSQWDNKKAKEFHIDLDKIKNMKYSEIPFVTEKKDGTLKLSDGRHRTRALYNDGYKYVYYPTYIEESLLNEDIWNISQRGYNSNFEDSKENILNKISNYLGYEVSEDDIDYLYDTALNNEDEELIGYIEYYKNINEDNTSLKENILNETRRGQTSLKKVMVEVAELLSDNFDENINYCIHHIDGNENNNQLNNIAIMSRGEHSSLHRKKSAKLDDYKSVIKIGPMLMDIVWRDGEPLSESLDINDLVKRLNESKQDIENFKVWADDEELVNDFFKYKDIIKNLGYSTDIYHYMKSEDGLNDLKNVVEQAKNTKSNTQKKKDAKTGADLLYNKNGWKVYKINTLEASQLYGKDTTWCITGNEGYDGEQYFGEYSEDYDIYFFINNNSKIVEQHKLALIVRDDWFAVFDSYDYQLPYVVGFTDSSFFRENNLPDATKALPTIAKIIKDNCNIDINNVKRIEANYSDYFEDYTVDMPLKIELNDGTEKVIKHWNSPRCEDVTDEYREWCKEYESLCESKEDQEKFKTWIGLDKINGKTTGEIYFDKFSNLKQQIKSPENDLYYWMKNKTPSQFKEFIDNLEIDVENKKNIRKKEQEGARLVYSDNIWKVYEITTYEASAKYGKNTKWCISDSKRWADGKRGSEFFDNYYNKDKVRFYFFIKNGNEKYALAVYSDNKHCEIFNAEDNKIAYIPDAPEISEIKVKYNDHSDNNILVNAIMNKQIDEKILLNLMKTVIAENADSDYVEIITDPKIVASTIENYIPEGYLEYEAVINGDLTKEEYKKITGEEFTDGWYGDMPQIDMNSLATIGEFNTKAEYCNPKAYEQHKYWVLTSDNYDGYINLDWADDYIGLYMLGNSLCNFNDWTDEDIADFYGENDDGRSRADMFGVCLANQLISEIQDGNISKDCIKNIGLSQEYLNKLRESLQKHTLTEMKGKQFIRDEKILKLIKQAKDKIMDSHFLDNYSYKGRSFSYDTIDSYLSDIDWMQGTTLHTFGSYYVPEYEFGNSTIVINEFMFNEPDEAILNTILHELCHYLVFKFNMDNGIFWWNEYTSTFKIDDKSLMSEYSGHGSLWKDIANKIGSLFNTTISRTDSYKTHTEVGKQFEDSVKYIVRCKNCGVELKYTRKTDFVKNPNISHYDALVKKYGQDWVDKNYSEERKEQLKNTTYYSCSKCGEGDWEVIEKTK